MFTVPELSSAMYFSLTHCIQQHAASQMTSHLQMDLLLNKVLQYLNVTVP